MQILRSLYKATKSAQPQHSHAKNAAGPFLPPVAMPDPVCKRDHPQNAGAARAITLYSYVSGADKISLQGYSASQATTALANQQNIGGGTRLSLSDGSVISMIGVGHATSSLFA